MKTIKLVVLLSLVSSTVFADPDRVGNGGDGVIIGNHIYVLDLVEAGVEENPFFNEEIQIDTEIQSRLEIIFSKIPNMPVNLLARKLSEIKAVDRIFALALLKTAEMYHWRLINEKYNDKKMVYILGMLDKDYKTFIDNLIPEESTVICTEPKSKRATEKEKLQEYVDMKGSRGILSLNLQDAIQEARKLNHDLILITGSLYLVGEALDLVKNNQITQVVLK